MTTSRRQPLPPPDAAGTDSEAVLRSRFTLGANPLAAVAPLASTPRPDTGTERPYTGKGEYGKEAERNPDAAPGASRTSRKTRDDPVGMRRVSYYVAEDAAAELDAAVAQVMTALAGIPKHSALSALLRAAAACGPEVTRQLATDRAAALSAQLEQLQQR